MNEQEIEIINKSIQAYEKMIKYLRRKIEILEQKKTSKCCFEEKIKIKFDIKER
jgi:prefoldin subunit 5